MNQFIFGDNVLTSQFLSLRNKLNFFSEIVCDIV